LGSRGREDSQGGIGCAFEGFGEGELERRPRRHLEMLMGKDGGVVGRKTRTGQIDVEDVLKKVIISSAQPRDLGMRPLRLCRAELKDWASLSMLSSIWQEGWMFILTSKTSEVCREGYALIDGL
jgi:hypothetical protein